MVDIKEKGSPGCLIEPLMQHSIAHLQLQEDIPI